MAALSALGFGEPQSRKALANSRGDMAGAVEWLCNNPDDPGLEEDAVPDYTPQSDLRSVGLAHAITSTLCKGEVDTDWPFA